MTTSLLLHYLKSLFRLVFFSIFQYEVSTRVFLQFLQWFQLVRVLQCFVWVKRNVKKSACTSVVYYNYCSIHMNFVHNGKLVYGTSVCVRNKDTSHMMCIYCAPPKLIYELRAKIKSISSISILTSCATKVQRCNLLSNNCSRNRSSLLSIHQ